LIVEILADTQGSWFAGHVEVKASLTVLF